MRFPAFFLGGAVVFSAFLHAEDAGLLPNQEELIAVPPLFLPVFNNELLSMGFSKERLFRKRGGGKQEKSNTGMIRHGHVQDPSLEWDWGFRTGVGYDTTVDNWSVAATYTRFHTKVFASTSTPTGLLVPTWGSGKAPPEDSMSDFAGPTWRLHLDLADVEIGRSFEAAEKVVLRPHLGVRGAWIYQRGKVEIPNELEIAPFKTKVPFFSNNCAGLGLRSGMDSFWTIGRGMSLYGDGALSLLAGYYNIDRKKRPIKQDLEMLDESNRASGGIATAEMSFGMQYERPVFTRSVFVIRLGYEMNYVFNQTRWLDWFSNAKGALADAGSGMSLQGLTLGIRLDY